MFNLRLNWVKREHNLTINMFTDELELLNLKKTDAGIYICSAENLLLSLKSETVAFINVE